MDQTSKFTIAKYIDENKDSIIQKYNENMVLSEIAEIYEVAESTIYFRLVKWGVKIKRCGVIRRRRNEKPIRQKREFSPELLAKRKENTRINNKYIKFYGTVETVHDKFLVREILRKTEVGK